MTVHVRRALSVAVVATLLVAGAACSDDDEPDAAPDAVELTDDVALDGTFDSGGTWEIRAPKGWNGSLLLYSHGYVAPELDNPAQLAPSDEVVEQLLAEGFALAGSSFPEQGWAFAGGMEDQLALLEEFEAQVGAPARTIAWGLSMGGLMTVALLEQHPDLFDGGVAMCGALAGSLALWDQALDTSYALRTLLAPDPEVQLVDITTDQSGAQQRLQDTLAGQVGTPLGAARIALVAALAGLPGSTGTEAGLLSQTQLLVTTAAIGGDRRAEVEERFGGNPSSNADDDPAAILARSPRREEVLAAYAAAGALFEEDLAALAAGPRVEADPEARSALGAEYTPTGVLQDPLMTLSTTADPFVVPGNERAYADLVRANGSADLLRHALTEREGHCAFLMSEVVPVLQALDARVKLGRWPVVDARTLQGQALVMGRELDEAASPGFVDQQPPVGPRFPSEE
jgi:pimeloyl-ACP methyl ester carboxylesterase